MLGSSGKGSKEPGSVEGFLCTAWQLLVEEGQGSGDAGLKGVHGKGERGGDGSEYESGRAKDVFEGTWAQKLLLSFLRVGCAAHDDREGSPRTSGAFPSRRCLPSGFLSGAMAETAR